MIRNAIFIGVVHLIRGVMRIFILFVVLFVPAFSDAQLIQNGDVNADGSRDIGDVVYLLGHLFQNGPEPVSIPMRLPFMDTTNVDARYINNGDGTWTDLWTNLTWITGDYYDQFNDGFNCPQDYFNNIEYAGHQDWRLPTPDEVMSLYPWGTPFVPNCAWLHFEESAYSASPIWGAWLDLMIEGIAEGTWPSFGNMRITVAYPESQEITLCGGGSHFEWLVWFGSQNCTQIGGIGPAVDLGQWSSLWNQSAGISVRAAD